MNGIRNIGHEGGTNSFQEIEPLPKNRVEKVEKTNPSKKAKDKRDEYDKSKDSVEISGEARELAKKEQEKKNKN